MNGAFDPATTILHLQNGFILPSDHRGEYAEVFQDRFHQDCPRVLNEHSSPVNVFLGGLIAFAAWVMARTNFDLSYAYFFMSLSFVFVALLSSLILDDRMTYFRLIGLALVVIGVIVGSRQ